jgi:hypothetical protein
MLNGGTVYVAYVNIPKKPAEQGICRDQVELLPTPYAKTN